MFDKIFGLIPHGLIAPLAAGAGVFFFVLLGIQLFRRGWQSYEQKYIAGAERTLDSMYLTMPMQHLVYLSLLASALAGALGYALTENPAIAVLGMAAGVAGPEVAIFFLKRARDQAFNLQLVDALMSVSNSLKAGFTMPQAFEVLSREMPNPMRQEMKLVVQELRLGVSVDDSLNHLLKRMPSADMDLVVTAISIVRDIGGNLTEVFDNIAGTIRERMRIEGKIRALTAQGKLQAVVISLLPVAVGIGMNAVAPGFISPLFNTFMGGVVLLVAVVCELIGILIIRKIIDIDV